MKGSEKKGFSVQKDNCAHIGVGDCLEDCLEYLRFFSSLGLQQRKEAIYFSYVMTPHSVAAFKVTNSPTHWATHVGKHSLRAEVVL